MFFCEKTLLFKKFFQINKLPRISFLIIPSLVALRWFFFLELSQKTTFVFHRVLHTSWISTTIENIIY